MEKLGEVKRKPSVPASVTFAIRLNQGDLDDIRKLAQHYGLGPTQLVRGWLTERLAIERAVGPLRPTESEYSASVQQTRQELRKKVMDVILSKHVAHLIDNVVDEMWPAMDEEAHHEEALAL